MVGHVLEAHPVADQRAQRHLHLLRHALGDRDGRDTPGLRDRDRAVRVEPRLVEELRNLGRLPGARLPNEDAGLVLGNLLQEPEIWTDAFNW